MASAPTVAAALVVVWLLGYELNILVGAWGGDGSVLFGPVAYESIMWAGAALCLIRGARLAQQRLIWVLVGLGCVLWVGADTYYQLVATRMQRIPIPSPADIGYLGFYPLMFAGIVLLSRERSGRRSSNQWLDGLAASLAAAAAVAAVGLHAVLSSLGGSAPEVATNLAYPVADLLLLATIAGGLAIDGPRRGTPLLRLALGMGLFCVGDILYLIHSADGTYAVGGWFDVVWPAGTSLIAAAACAGGASAPRSSQSPQESTLGPIALPIAFALLSVGLLVYGGSGHLNALARGLAAASLVAVLVRLAATFRDYALVSAARARDSVTDALTGLPNRRALMRDLQALERAIESGGSAEVVMLDLDGFKHYNDTFGHHAGDAQLIRLGAALLAIADQAGRVYRIGGDEFCLLADDSYRRRGLCGALTTLTDNLAVSASYGQARVPQDAPGAESALRMADQRMHAQKRASRDLVAHPVAQVLNVTHRIPTLSAWTWDLDADALFVPEGLRRMIGVDDPVGLSMTSMLEAIPSEDRPAMDGAIEELRSGRAESVEVEYRLRAADGAVHWRHNYCDAVRDRAGRLTQIVGVAIDVTAAKETERELKRASKYLRTVTDSIEEAMFTLDVQGCVRYLNPSAERLLGWSTRELSGRLMHEVTHFRKTDGSPFPVEQCPILAARGRGEVVHVDDDVFIRSDGSELPVEYTATPFATDDGIEGCVVVFADITERKLEERRVAADLDKLMWARRIRDALAGDHFVLYAQPIIDLKSSKIVQRELLIRMRDPGSERVIEPAAFLPVAEELGLIREIDRWVVGRAVEIAATGASVELNVSARSICDVDLVAHIERALQRSGADPKTLVFEITETAVVSDRIAAEVFVGRLRQLGCRVALDDFGTGFGSFTYLKQLAVDYLKIDREFVRDLGRNPASRRVVEAVVNLADGFGLQTVAEGVEDEHTLELLRELRVDYGQGFLIGRPAPLVSTGGHADGPRAAGTRRSVRSGAARQSVA
ncbi:MAG TPA: EAL domain-containing protein [Solirubrobacteraceae bacterium]|nr:EAL domain-containing protein [Solirubrobacteraceae bacterium]